MVLGGFVGGFGGRMGYMGEGLMGYGFECRVGGWLRFGFFKGGLLFGGGITYLIYAVVYCGFWWTAWIICFHVAASSLMKCQG